MKGFYLILAAIILVISLSGCTEVLPGQSPENTTPDQATREQDLAFEQAWNSSLSMIMPLRDQFSRDLEAQDWSAVASSAADLMAGTEQQYASISRFSVSPEVHGIQANYLRALQELNQAAEDGSKAVVAATGNNPDLTVKHSGSAGSHLRSAGTYLDLATGAMDRYRIENRGS
jgi:uncharacterized protein YceK